MTRTQADQLLLKYEHLVGQQDGKRFISALIIAPLNHDGITELAFNVMNSISSFDILHQVSEFDVVILYDLDDWRETGYFEKDSLVLFLDRNPHLKV